MENATKVAEVLERAAEVIEERGWCQNDLYTADGRLCLMGAVDRVTRTEAGVFLNAMEAMDEYVIDNYAARRGIGLRPCVTWNDSADRTEHEVIDALRRCAKDIRNG